VINMKAITVECQQDDKRKAPTIIIWKEEKEGSRVGWHLSIDEGMAFFGELRSALKTALFLERSESDR